MSDTERERIRERKKRELLEKHGVAPDSTAADSSAQTDSPTQFDSPVEIQSREQLDRLVSEQQLVLVDCYADWCGPCQMMEPTIQTVASESPAVVAKVDVDTHQSLAGQLGVQGVPTLVLFADGQAVERLVGAQNRATLDGLIQQYA